MVLPGPHLIRETNAVACGAIPGATKSPRMALASKKKKSHPERSIFLPSWLRSLQVIGNGSRCRSNPSSTYSYQEDFFYPPIADNPR
jgi:hypothetical protein